MPVITIDLPETAEQQLARFVEVFGTEPDCSFADQNWDYPVFLLGPPHLMCDTHHEIADSSVYVADPGEEAGLCRIQHQRLVEEITDRVYKARDRELAANPPRMLASPA